MKIKQIDITNFRGIDHVQIPLSKKINILVGINGSGKTTILDTMVISLSWLINRIQRETANGRQIADSDIRNGENYADIVVTTYDSRIKAESTWRISKVRKGHPIEHKSELTTVSDLASFYRSELRENETLPIIVYYPINRAVNTTTTTTTTFRSIDTVQILDVYENALGGKANYQSFFEWFRFQDDIVNEKAQSRTKWMIKHKAWVKRKTKKLLSHLEKLPSDRFGIKERQHQFSRFEKDDFLYEEPRYLFYELIELFHWAIKDTRNQSKVRILIKDIEYLLHTMASLSDSRRDDVIDFNKFPSAAIERMLIVIQEFYHKDHDLTEIKLIISFIWDALLFSILLSLWWMSDKGKKEVELLFAKSNPSRNKDVDNKMIKLLLSSVEKAIHSDTIRLDKANSNQGREFRHVTKAIENFLPGYANLRISRLPKPHLLIDKNGSSIDLDQLSDGEKNIIALVGDIARRLSIANARSRNPLNGRGVILIDEIDLHLHPAWQRLMIPNLTKLFPNCQFIVTTHSPQILSHVHPNEVFILKNNKQFSVIKATESYGKNSDRILEDLLGVDARPTTEKRMLHTLFALIQENKLEEARDAIDKLFKLIGEDPELTKAEVLIKRKQIIGK